MKTAACHAERKHYGRGLCFACYMRQLRKNDPSWNAGKRPKYQHGPASCHPDRKKVVADGLCNTCYRARWRQRNPGKSTAYQRTFRLRHGRTEERLAFERAYRAKHAEKLRARSRAYLAKLTPRERKALKLWTNYRMTIEQFDALVAKHGGRCAICQKERVLEIDHCHASGRVRGLLCRPCNTRLGWYERCAPMIATYVSAPASVASA